MQKNTLKLLTFLFVFVRCVFVLAQNNFYETGGIQKIEIFFSQPNWDYMMDTAKVGLDDYILSDSVKINGTLLDSIGVKYKGNSSYNATYIKNPLHIELDRFKQQDYQGFKDIKLSNQYSDPSLIREVLAYKILRNYMHAPESNFAQVYINGDYIGIYTNDEHVGKTFCATHFGSSNNTFIKCNPIITPGPTTKSNLKYVLGGDSSSYFNFYEMKSDYGWNELVLLCDTVTNYSSVIGNNIDMDRVIWMLAFNNLIVNLDSYSGVFCQNYYLYKDNTQHFNPIVWDLNMAFGAFPFLGSGASSFGTLSTAAMQQLPLNFHATDPYWPLINAVFSNSSYKKMYIAHLKTMSEEFFSNGLYISEAQQLQALIDTAVLNDANNFFTYNDFQQGLTANVQGGTYTIPGISTLMDARNIYLQSTTEFLYASPGITSVSYTPVVPLVNNNISITALVNNASSVWLAYRYHTDLKFVKTPMFDDGMHNDGVAGDFIYGANLLLSDINLQYYIYAENNEAAMFSPQRAEHEFYNLTAAIPLPLVGSISINELLASNTIGQQNELGDFEDWIELFNNTDTAINLHGLYLSDDFAVPNKYAFPANTIINPNSFITVWADQEPLSTGLHANFKLSANGEQLILSDGGLVVYDSIVFGAQPENISFARCPDGTGNFTQSNQPTFNGSNCTQGLILNKKEYKILCYPNPSKGLVTFNFENEKSLNQISISNIMGEQVLTLGNIKNNEIIDLGELVNGMYFISVNQSQSVKLILNR